MVCPYNKLITGGHEPSPTVYLQIHYLDWCRPASFPASLAGVGKEPCGG